ncbi:MAG: YkgJ family cysteine cluster protein [Promethearchaeota archaeon]
MKENSSEFTFKCKKCGSCCRAGLEVSIRKEDVLKWLDLGKLEILKNIQIDAKSISSEGLAGYHIEEKNALLDLLQKYDKNLYESKKRELADFIIKNHEYLGEGILPLPIYTFIPELGRMPILVPKYFNTILEGIDRGLEYIIRFENNGTCPFLKENICAIHEIKPLDCKNFPYNDKGKLKLDNYFLKICKGIKKNLK